MSGLQSRIKKGSKTKSYRFGSLLNGPRKGRFGARRLLGEAGDFSNLVHDVVEALQKGLTRGAQGRILGVDHDVVEEAVDRAAKNGKCREHLLVFAGGEVLKGLGFDVVDGGEELLFSVFGKKGLVDDRRDFALDLLEDVADALVGGGQGFGFRRAMKARTAARRFGSSSSFSGFRARTASTSSVV